MTEDTFNFRGKNSFDDFGIYATVADPMFAPKRARKVEIPDVHGAIDFGTIAFGEKDIPVRCWLVNEMTRAQFRDVAAWLSGKGQLIFSDEIDKYYIAEIFSMPKVDLETLNRMKYFDLMFVAEPFAYGENKNVPLQNGLNIINYEGTAETPVIITIINNGDEPIMNIQISFFNKEE